MSQQGFPTLAFYLGVWLAFAALGCTPLEGTPRSLPDEISTPGSAPSGAPAATAPRPTSPSPEAVPDLNTGSLPTLSPDPPDPISSAGPNGLTNPDVGYSLLVPEGWAVRGQVQATEFAAGAACESVEAAGSTAPPDSGSAAGAQHAFVQVCARPLTDGLALEAFMRQTYGESFSNQFQPYILGGAPAYRAANARQDATLFVQANGYRLQITTAVAAPTGVEASWRAQIQAILESFTFLQP